MAVNVLQRTRSFPMGAGWRRRHPDGRCRSRNHIHAVDRKQIRKQRLPMDLELRRGWLVYAVECVCIGSASAVARITRHDSRPNLGHILGTWLGDRKASNCEPVEKRRTSMVRQLRLSA